MTITFPDKACAGTCRGRWGTVRQCTW